MSVAITSLSAGARHQEFSARHKRCCTIGADHEGVTERYSIESDSGEFDFGIEVSVASTVVKPKAILAERHQVLFVAFDKFICAIPTTQAGSIIKYRLEELDWLFLDMFVVENDCICVVHELGAVAYTSSLMKVWSVSTELLAEWTLDPKKQVLTLTAEETGAAKRIAISSGKVLM